MCTTVKNETAGLTERQAPLGGLAFCSKVTHQLRTSRSFWEL